LSKTIRDIAREAKVSSATVSRVLNNSGYVKKETRDKIINTIEKMDYVPSAIARSLSNMETNTIGVVVPDIQNPFFGEVIKGISSIADQHNLKILLCDTDENYHDKEIKHLAMLKEQRIRGLIITPTSEENELNSEFLKSLENLGIPIVLLDRDVKYSNFDGVFIDNIGGAFAATNALIQEGHVRIAHIAGPITSLPGRDRLEGYRKAYLVNNVPFDDQLVFYGDFKQRSGYELTKQILKLAEKPSAIFVANNLMTMGCVKALREAHLNIPDNIALIGFDEVEAFSILGLNISYVSRPTVEMGQAAMDILLGKLNIKNAFLPTRRITLPTRLILEGSEKLVK
jgi:LacI family transcriptional regulator